jgi:hypothetical protein
MNLKPAVAAAASAAADAAAAKCDSSGSSGGGEVLVQQGPTATVFREQLSGAGFRADRLSVWVFQGLHDQGIDSEVLRQLLAEVADSAAFHRWVLLGDHSLQQNVVDTPPCKGTLWVGDCTLLQLRTCFTLLTLASVIDSSGHQQCMHTLLPPARRTDRCCCCCIVACVVLFRSLVVGELPGPLTRREADNLLAESGLLGAVYDYATADAGQYKRWQEGAEPQTASSSSSGGAEGEVGPRWICAGQQLRLSLAQMGIYDEWSTEYEEADFGDDFIGNVS